MHYFNSILLLNHWIALAPAGCHALSVQGRAQSVSDNLDTKACNQQCRNQTSQ